MENSRPTIPGGETKVQVVFVDDAESALNCIRLGLQPMQSEWEMLFFSGPEAALAALDSFRDAVIVADWMMPGMDGLAFQEEARKRLWAANSICAYFIVLTARQSYEDEVHALERGFDDYIAKPVHFGELIARIRVGVRMVLSERRLRQAHDKLAFLATTDPLTGLFNRRHGLRMLDAEISRVRRGKQHLSVIMMDVDHLQSINDRHGREAGDRLLSQFGAQLRFTLRNYDVLIRWGEDEFVIVCPHTNAIEVQSVTTRLLRDIRRMVVVLGDGEQVKANVTMGTASTDVLDPSGIEDPVSAADKAMARAKFSGGNTVCHFLQD